MNRQQQTRNQKLLVIQEAMNGNVAPLKSFFAHQGRAYTQTELEQRRLVVSELLGREATQDETIRMLGRYDKSRLPGTVCLEFTDTIRAYLN